jgi:hypothetical protein
MLASHPYAVLVVAAQGLFILVRRRRVREAALTLAAVGVVGVPFWWADIVLRNRFDVGVGGGGPQLGSPTSVLHYFWWVSGDFSAGHHAWSIPVLLLALVGAVLLWRERREVVVLIGCVIAIPALAFMLATLNSTASPEARHLIFALPFFSILLAVPLVELARLRPPLTGALALVAVLTLVVGEVRWAHEKTPQLFDGDPASDYLISQTTFVPFSGSFCKLVDYLLQENFTNITVLDISSKALETWKGGMAKLAPFCLCPALPPAMVLTMCSTPSSDSTSRQPATTPRWEIMAVRETCGAGRRWASTMRDSQFTRSCLLRHLFKPRQPRRARWARPAPGRGPRR